MACLAQLLTQMGKITSLLSIKTSCTENKMLDVYTKMACFCIKIFDCSCCQEFKSYFF